MIKALLTALLLGTLGCVHGGLNLKPGPVKFYEGPEAPAESLATLENDPNMFFASIDGRDLRRWQQSHDVLQVQVRPGTRVIVAAPSERAGFVSMDAARIEFVAEAGHRYVVSRRLRGGSNRGPDEWTVVFKDMTTGKELLP